MGAREQFAGWGMYDNSAVCLTCGHQHLIPKSEQITDQPWLDWQHKHLGHETFILPAKLLTALGDQVAGLKHNADAKVAYVASAAYTITLTGLATSSTLVAGRESTALSNASNKYLDALVAGFITVGTTPTANTLIEVHCVGALNDTPLYPDVFDGTNSAETVSNTGIKAAICRPVGVMLVPATTSDLAYPFAPLGIRQLFGDAMPPAHVLFVTHSTAVNLNATAANHAIYHTQVYATIA
ncbi:MAG: hypothetical protein ACREQF_01595 [Candidatus Binataceae bacterium]